MTRLCVLIPHFPSQTASFYWREIGALERLGIAVDVVSTKPPDRLEVCHAWSREAIARTEYLVPLTPRRCWRAMRGSVGAGPRRWIRCARAIWRAEGVSKLGRLRLCAVSVLGGELASLAVTHGASHLHAHSCADAAFIAMFASILSGIPYSLTLHGELSGYGPGQNVKWSNAAFGTAVTETLKRSLLASVPGLEATKVDVAPMGVDLETFSRRSPYQPPRAGGCVRLMSCGRLHPGKGHQDVIRAVAGLRAAAVDATLEILGEGPARGELGSLVTELGLERSVTLHGAVGEHSVRAELEKAHAFVLASHDEAIGVATMEAMAMQVPVVVTDVGGVRELVRDGVDGLMIPPRDSVAVQQAVRRLIAEPDLCERLGRNGRARVCAHFGSKGSARALARRLSDEGD